VNYSREVEAFSESWDRSSEAIASPLHNLAASCLRDSTLSRSWTRRRTTFRT